MKRPIKIVLTIHDPISRDDAVNILDMVANIAHAISTCAGATTSVDAEAGPPETSIPLPDRAPKSTRNVETNARGSREAN